MGRSFSNSFLAGAFPRATSLVGLLTASLMAQANTILAEKWDNITGTAVTSLTSNAAYPNSPTSRSNPTLYELGTNVGDNYGTRTRGYVTPPTTGSYTFWIACDDNCELWLGTSSDPASATKIAGVSGTNWTNSREWTKFTEQQSAAKTLTAGVQYYIETRQKEGNGGDNLAVGWQGPGITGETERPIPGTRLSPWVIPVAPSITTQPANQTVNAGASATFTVVASGTAPLSYQWRKGGTNISGATSASYSTPATVAGDNGALFSVVVTNSAGSTTSSNATLTVNLPPTISTQPANTTVIVPATATFTVAATGSGTLTYQWRKGGTNIPGATSASYTTPATVSGDDGSLFSVVVTNSLGSVTSGNATLTCITPPSITTQPASQTVTVGQTATFSVVASGSATLTYQWRKGGVNISGATSATYTTPATVSGDNGALFSVVVSNGGGSITSSNATLTVNAAPTAPTITVQPANTTVTYPAAATFSVTATGTAPFTYQWRKGEVNIAGATSSSYTTPATASGDDGAVFSVVVSNAQGSVTSSNAILTVIFPITVGTPPADQTVNLGQTATFSVVVSGTSPITYQWRKNSINISGATSSTYTTPATVVTDDGALFSVVVTNSAGSVTVGPATLQVRIPPGIVTPPANQSVTVGQTATFSVTASGTTPYTYQWLRGGTTIPGATSSTYTPPPTVPSDNGTLYSVTVNNPVGPAVTSPTATLTVNQPPSILTQPADQTVALGETATLNVTANGTPTLTYQWRKNGSAINGATSASYTTPAVTSGDNGALFSVVVTNNYGTVTSVNATLSIGTPITITVQPQDMVVAETQSAIFSITGQSSQSMTYQWKKNGVDISGATAATYSTPAAAPGDNGALFSCVISGPGSTATSRDALLQVVSTKLAPGLVHGSSPVLDVSSVYDANSDGTRNGMSINTANGASSSGDAVSLAVTTSAGANNSGTVTAQSISATEGAQNAADLTGLKVSVTKDASATNSTAYGLRVLMSADPNAKAYSAVFSGGNVGIGTTSPSEALEVAGNLKMGAALMGNWTFGTEPTYGNLTLTHENGTTVFQVWSDFEGLRPHVEFQKRFALTGEDVHDYGLDNHYYTDFDYQNGIAQNQSVTSDQTGQEKEGFSSLLDSKSLMFDATYPVDGSEGILSSNTDIEQAGIHFDQKFYSGPNEDPLEYTAGVNTYGFNLGLTKGQTQLSATSINPYGISTNQWITFYGVPYEGNGYTITKNAWLGKDNGLENSWLTTYTDGSHLQELSGYNRNSVTLSEERDIPGLNGAPSKLGYSNKTFLTTRGLNSEQYSTQLDGGEFQYKYISVLDYATLQMDYKDEVDATTKHMELGYDGIHFTQTLSGDPVVATDIDLNGVATTGLMWANAMYAATAITADTVHANVVVTTPKWKIPDYVFEKKYKLESLESVGKYVEANKHLPNVPSAQEIKDKGMDLTEMNIKLLEKVEELTLHMIEMDKNLKSQQRKNETLEKTVRKLQAKGKEK